MPAGTSHTRLLSADAQGIADAVQLLEAGKIIAIPTETVYGLAADAANARAVAAIYAAKGRPSFNPLIVHAADMDMARRYGMFSPLAQTLADALWPGPLTLVVPMLESAPVASLVTAGLPTIAIRIPAHPVMHDVISRLGRAVAAPSANASGRLSPTRAGHVLHSLKGRVPLILDAGPTSAGLESSIVAVADTTPVLLRYGAIPPERIEAIVGGPLTVVTEGEVAAPGMLLRHYAPDLPLRLDVRDTEPGDFHIGFGCIAGDLNLSPSGDIVEAAANLFDVLHRAQASGRKAIAVAPIPEAGLGLAIKDRLLRAARG